MVNIGKVVRVSGTTSCKKYKYITSIKDETFTWWAIVPKYVKMKSGKIGKSGYQIDKAKAGETLLSKIKEVTDITVE